jgi:hypothetical protein
MVKQHLDTLLNHVSCCSEAAKRPRSSLLPKGQKGLLLPKGQKELAAAEELAVAELAAAKARDPTDDRVCCLVKMGPAWHRQQFLHIAYT